MFLCSDCHDENCHIHFAQSYGRCEVCKQSNYCVDCLNYKVKTNHKAPIKNTKIRIKKNGLIKINPQLRKIMKQLKTTGDIITQLPLILKLIVEENDEIIKFVNNLKERRDEQN